MRHFPLMLFPFPCSDDRKDPERKTARDPMRYKLQIAAFFGLILAKLGLGGNQNIPAFDRAFAQLVALCVHYDRSGTNLDDGIELTAVDGHAAGGIVLIHSCITVGALEAASK